MNSPFSSRDNTRSSSSVEDDKDDSPSRQLLTSFDSDPNGSWAVLQQPFTVTPRRNFIVWLLVGTSWFITLVALFIASRPSIHQGDINNECYDRGGCPIREGHDKVVGWRAPDFGPLKPVVFVKNMTFMGRAVDVKDAWQPLLDVANGGRVHVAGDEEPFFAVAGIHSVHCSWYFLQAIDMAEAGTKPNKDLVKHMRHCVEYLRLSAMCFADGTLERPFHGTLGSLKANNVHMCRDYGQLIAWSEENKYRGI